MKLTESVDAVDLVEIFGIIDYIEANCSESKLMESIESILNQMYGSKVKLVESIESIGLLELVGLLGLIEVN